MAKGRHDEAQSSKTPLIIMTLGAIIVAALVVWALTRTVEPSAPASTTVAETTAPVGVEQPAASTMPPLEGMPPTSTATLAPPANTETHAQVEGDRAAVPRIAVEDLRAKINRGEVTVIDVRDQTSFEVAHIPGSLHIPLARTETEIPYLPKDKPIVTYCT